MNDEIPEMIDPLGKCWPQPIISEILVDSKTAIMELVSFNQLLEYSGSFPSGVYVGKMWKRLNKKGWVLCVYNRIIGDEIEIKYRDIIII